jgi:hypothetical protein
VQQWKKLEVIVCSYINQAELPICLNHHERDEKNERFNKNIKNHWVAIQDCIKPLVQTFQNLPISRINYLEYITSLQIMPLDTVTVRHELSMVEQ